MKVASRGQAMVEFALVSVLLLVIVLGIMDFSFLFAGRVTAYQATRATARFAATSPNSSIAIIQAHLKVTGIPATVSSPTIRYYVVRPGSAVLVECAHDIGSGLIINPGYTKGADCVIPGNLITISASYTYSFITPMLKRTVGTLVFTTVASATEEVP